jgi:hypothetical protein
MLPSGNLPTPDVAERLLAEAAKLNPGAWVRHSWHVARAAQVIAARLPDLDVKAAGVLGLLHDIGRRNGVTGLRHVIDGYDYLQTLGYPAAARISLTHSFPLPEVGAFAGAPDVTPSQLHFLRTYLAEVEYDPYDRLVQLCDALCLPDGVCLIEKRIVDVVLRYGMNEFSVPKWKAILSLQADFERALGCSLYALFPEAVDNSFAPLESVR